MKHLVILSFLLTSVWTTSVAQTEKQEQMVTGKEIVDKAKAYYANGWLIETGLHCRQKKTNELINYETVILCMVDSLCTGAVGL